MSTVARAYSYGSRNIRVRVQRSLTRVRFDALKVAQAEASCTCLHIASRRKAHPRHIKIWSSTHLPYACICIRSVHCYLQGTPAHPSTIFTSFTTNATQVLKTRENGNASCSPEIESQDGVLARVENHLDVFAVRGAGDVVVHRLLGSVRGVELHGDGGSTGRIKTRIRSGISSGSNRTVG